MRALWLVIFVSACAPRIPGGEGHFRCGALDECPPTAPFCHADQRCHRGPEDAAMLDGGRPIDARPMDTGRLDAGMVQRCGDPSPMCTGTTRCIREVGEPEGYCAPMASTPEACGDGVLLGDGYCRLGCDSESDCIGTDCTFGRWRGTAVTGACVESMAARPAGYASDCTDDASCPHPYQCVDRHCGRSCTAAGDTLPCGFGEVCGPLPAGAGSSCLITCGAGETCPAGTMCRMPGGGAAACLPDM